MEIAKTASADAAASALAGSCSRSSSDAKPAIDATSTPAAVDNDADADDSSAPSSRPTAQPQAPQTPSVSPGTKQGSMTTATERESAAREVLQALTASSSLFACSSSSAEAASQGVDPSAPARRVLFTADDAGSEEDFASDDSDAVERALRRARGRASAGGGGGGGAAAGRRPPQHQGARTAAGTAAATAAAAPRASSLQPANASARRLDAVFDGALRQAYFYGNGNGGEDDGYDDFEDNAAGGGGGNSGKGHGGGGGGSGPSSSNSSAAARHRDKSDRATVETVLDPRTRLVLFKLLNSGVFASIHGCVSTGKEANVYLALPGPSNASSRFGALAVKVYKTSILAFKDRERYVEGDARFSGSNGGGGGGGFGGGGGKGASSKAGYCKGNARKMVRAWAEKEARNLARLAAAGVRAPAVVCLRSHVLAMEFVSDGSDGGNNAAPRLKDARLSRSRAAAAYAEALGAMRAMWARARLVHADLSEYNMLYAPVRREGRSGEEEGEGEGAGAEAGDGGGGGGNDGGASGGDEKPNPSSKRRPGKRGDGGARKPPTHSVVIIDVSQSVDLDHPRALEFLRVDAGNVNSFFARRGVPPLTTREVFDFVTADAGAYPDDSGGGSSSSSASLSTAAARGAAAPPTTTTPFTAATAAPASSCADFDPSRTSMMTPGEERHLGALLRAAALRSERSVASGGALAPERSAEDAVWASAHIPRRLADVADAEGDAARLAEGGGVAEGIYYQRFAGMAEDMGNVRIEEEKVEEEKEKKKERREKKKTVSFAAAADDDGENGGGEEEEEGAVCGASDSGDEDDIDSSSDSGSDDDSFSGSDSDFSDSSQRLRRRSLKARACNLPPDEADAARALRRAAKAEAKAGARERRKTKTPKHVKKRAAAKARKKKK